MRIALRCARTSLVLTLPLSKYFCEKRFFSKGVSTTETLTEFNQKINSQYIDSLSFNSIDGKRCVANEQNSFIKEKEYLLTLLKLKNDFEFDAPESLLKNSLSCVTCPICNETRKLKKAKFHLCKHFGIEPLKNCERIIFRYNPNFLIEEKHVVLSLIDSIADGELDSLQSKDEDTLKVNLVKKSYFNDLIIGKISPTNLYSLASDYLLNATHDEEELIYALNKFYNDIILSVIEHMCQKRQELYDSYYGNDFLMEICDNVKETGEEEFNLLEDDDENDLESSDLSENDFFSTDIISNESDFQISISDDRQTEKTAARSVKHFTLNNRYLTSDSNSCLDPHTLVDAKLLEKLALEEKEEFDIIKEFCSDDGLPIPLLVKNEYICTFCVLDSLLQSRIVGISKITELVKALLELKNEKAGNDFTKYLTRDSLLKHLDESHEGSEYYPILLSVGANQKVKLCVDEIEKLIPVLPYRDLEDTSASTEVKSTSFPTTLSDKTDNTNEQHITENVDPTSLPFSCELCGTIFSDEGQLLQHLEYKHSNIFSAKQSNSSFIGLGTDKRPSTSSSVSTTNSDINGGDAATQKVEITTSKDEVKSSDNDGNVESDGFSDILNTYESINVVVTYLQRLEANRNMTAEGNATRTPGGGQKRRDADRSCSTVEERTAARFASFLSFKVRCAHCPLSQKLFRRPSQLLTHIVTKHPNVSSPIAELFSMVSASGSKSDCQSSSNGPLSQAHMSSLNTVQLRSAGNDGKDAVNLSNTPTRSNVDVSKNSLGGLDAAGTGNTNSASSKLASGNPAVNSSVLRNSHQAPVINCSRVEAVGRLPTTDSNTSQEAVDDPSSPLEFPEQITPSPTAVPNTLYYWCNLCNKGYGTARGLDGHMVTKHGKEPRETLIQFSLDSVCGVTDLCQFIPDNGDESDAHKWNTCREKTSGVNASKSNSNTSNVFLDGANGNNSLNSPAATRARSVSIVLPPAVYEFKRPITCLCPQHLLGPRLGRCAKTLPEIFSYEDHLRAIHPPYYTLIENAFRNLLRRYNTPEYCSPTSNSLRVIPGNAAGHPVFSINHNMPTMIPILSCTGCNRLFLTVQEARAHYKACHGSGAYRAVTAQAAAPFSVSRNPDTTTRQVTIEHCPSGAHGTGIPLTESERMRRQFEAMIAKQLSFFRELWGRAVMTPPQPAIEMENRNHHQSMIGGVRDDRFRGPRRGRAW